MKGDDLVYSGHRPGGAMRGGSVGELSKRPETPLMHEIHVIEAEYGSLTRCPEDDKHLLLARAIANDGMTAEQIKQAEKTQRIARLIASRRAKANAVRKAVVDGYREFGDLRLTAEKMGYTYDSVARYVSQARKLGELPKKGKTK